MVLLCKEASYGFAFCSFIGLIPCSVPILFSTPMPLGSKAEPFNDPEWIFERKYDGFRALAVVEYGRSTLCSRNGHPFASFRDLATRIGNVLMPRSLVMDGEIVCLDEHGHCQLSELLFRRGEPRFIAFDRLHASGKDLRRERLLDRKHELRRVIGNGLPPIIFADHIHESGIALFVKLVNWTLEGIVALSISTRLTIPGKALGSRSGIRTIRRRLDARNYLSGTSTGSLFRGGTLALWHLQQ